jgi:hypothetical protein
LAYFLAHKRRVIDAHFRPVENSRNPLLDTAFTGLRTALSGGVRFGGALNLAASCKKAVSGALALYSMDQLHSTRQFALIIKSADRFERALLEIVRQHFSAPAWIAHPL